tara:strand:+ start:1057 stop:1266 length:210 start_codon:yes stop_codon:yes gene_type:complete
MMVCPKDKTHGRFIVTAHVTEDWIVDGEGNFVELSTKSDCQVLHEPDEQDVWTCAICGAEANKRNEKIC